MLKVLSSILCDLDPKVKVIGQKAGICDGVPSTSALVSLQEQSIFLVEKSIFLCYSSGSWRFLRVLINMWPDYVRNLSTGMHL